MWKESFPEKLINNSYENSNRRKTFSITHLINVCGASVVLLTAFYDMCDYVPTKKDVKFMVKSILCYCRDDAQFDKLVEWLFSKNLTHLLTHFVRANFCLHTSALVKNVMKQDTLSMVYTKLHFNVGTIFPYAVLCKRSEAFVNTIVELSGDVNLVDETKSTLLHWAAFYQKFTVIKHLLSIGANVNARNAYVSTPLYNVF